MDRQAVDAAIITLASSQGMVLTTAQLRQAGINRNLIESRRGGLLTPLARGVYAVGELTPAVRLRAALAVVPESAASHHSAAWAHRLPVQRPVTVEVITGRRTVVTIEGVRARSTAWLPPDDLVELDGITVTSAARTLCDLAGVVPRSRTSHLIEVAISDRLVSAEELQACARAWCRRGRRGSGVIRALDHELLDTEPMAESVLERKAIGLLREAGLTGWRQQYRPPWYDGVRGVVDLACPELGVVIELDGRRWHATAQAQAEDRRRDRAAVAHGWITLRFGWQEIVYRPATVIDECRRVLSARRRQIR